MATPSLAAGFVEDPAQPPSLAAGFQEDQTVPQESAGRSFLLNATNVFGAAPALSGALRYLTEGTPYKQGRDEYQAQIDAAKDQHKYASGAGSVASLLPETALGGAFGKVIGAGAKGIGLASKAAPFLEANPVLDKVIHGIGAGGAYGAASGAGTALSHGDDVLSSAAKGAAVGGAFGGALGGVTAKAGQLISKGIESQNESIVRGAAERALPKKQGALAALIESDSDVGTQAKKASIGAGDVLQENYKILKGARSKDYNTVSQTRQAIEDKVSSYESAKAAAYKNVDTATNGGIDAGDLTESLKNAAARTTERPYKKVLLNKATQLEEDYGSVNTDQAKKALLDSVGAKPSEDAIAAQKQLQSVIDDPNASQAAKERSRGMLAKIAPEASPDKQAVADFAASLPEGKQWTAKDFLNHSVGDTKSADFNPDVRKAIEGLDFTFDPKLKIPSQEVRALLTSSQEEAESALGTLNATKNAKLASQNQKVIGSVMNRGLAAAKKSGIEGIDQDVQSIYDTNLRQSVLLKLNEGLASKEDKLKIAKLGLGGQAGKLGFGLLAGHELVGSFGKVLSGDLPGAGLDLAKAAAIGATPKLLSGARNAATDTLAGGNRVFQSLQSAAKAGNPRAIRLFQALRAAKSVGTAGAGAVGSVTAGTLGQSQP